MTIGELKEIIEREGLDDSDGIMLGFEGTFTISVDANSAEHMGKRYLDLSEE